MGLFDFLKKPKGRAFQVRENFEQFPKTEWTPDEYDWWFLHCSEPEYWAEWEEWSKRTVEPPAGIKGITRKLLDAAATAAKTSFPNEFACLLAAHDGIVDELVFVPTIQGDSHAIMDLHAAPHDVTIVGTLHSHPDTHPYPSDADFELFDHQGKLHIIMAMDFNLPNFRAYDGTGQPVKLEMLDG